jgi:DNA-directed RNA polymerase subunit F
MKPTIAFDTAALISLGHTTLVELIVNHVTILITDEIKKELQTIAQRDDEDAASARKWLSHISEFVTQNKQKKESAEDELFEICKQQHIVLLLYKKEIITKYTALLSIEKMKTKRDWKQNLIAVTAQSLFE